ncbi:trace amine-associated receptor 13c-like [Acanthaster planci]|uniref:Trace amine-associated receptor 13c-like n=1 Tax=Acanthaster planci TaxID=133434 RepID=A0A8B7XND2_ACAPL|nr:trace amine-associated receptor 13c-like [Acanthaster planci]
MADVQTDSFGLPPFLIALRTCFIVTVATLIIAGNSLSIAVTRRVTNLADSTKVLMMTLAASDLLIGVLALFSSVASALGRWPFSTIGCAVASDCVNIAISMTIFSLIGLNVDRYIAVTRPYEFPVWCTARRVITLEVILLSVTTSSLIVAHVTGVSFKYYPASALCFFGSSSDAVNMVALVVFDLLPTLAMTCIYSRIIRISRQHELRNARNNQTEGNNVRDNKALKAFLMVTLTFAACYTPFNLMRTVEGLANWTSPHWLEFLTMWLTAANSGFNVFIYCLFNEAYRQTAKKIIHQRLQCCMKSPVEPLNI